jgi:hypothetical protein
LIAIDLPPLDFKFSYSQFFPIFGPLGASITGTLGATIDFGPMGYDTRGLSEFFDSGSAGCCSTASSSATPPTPLAAATTSRKWRLPAVCRRRRS